jgi:hypothetical protein
VALWVLAGGLLAWTGHYFWVEVPERQRQTITLSFRDANEMSRGASVQMMGVDIGYVDDIRVKGDHVDVVVKTIPGTLKIPPGSRATILFTGLVGSKSIEIEPPRGVVPHVSGTPLVAVEEPIRLIDFYQFNIDIAQALQGGAENFADFFGRRKPVEELQHNILTSETATAIAVETLTSGLNRIKYMGGEYRASRDNFFIFLGHAEAGMTHAAQVLDKRILGASTFTVLHYLEALFGEAELAMQEYRTHGSRHSQKRLEAFRQHIANLSHRVDTWDPHRRLIRINDSLRHFDQSLASIDQTMDHEYVPLFKRIQDGVRRFNDALVRLNTWLDKL